MRGFGALPGVFGDQGVSPPAAISNEEGNRAIKDIRDKYCSPPILQTTPFNLDPTTTPATAFVKVDLSQSPHNSFIVSVESGSVRIFFGDFGGDVSSIGHITVPAGSPFQLMKPYAGQIYTIVNTDDTDDAIGCFTAVNI
jgi:hypothetical protein